MPINRKESSRKNPSLWINGINNCGFSIIELTITLVLIGTILILVLKGFDMVTKARYKSELNRVHKIRTAVSIYYENHNTLPGNTFQNGTFIDTSSYQAKQELTSAGLLRPADFQLEVGEGFYAFRSCKAGTGGYFINGGTGLCITPTETYEETEGNRVLSDELWCVLETGEDDGRLNGGDIRAWVNGLEDETLDTLGGLEQCRDYADSAVHEFAVKIW
ncbi:type II secretion system protein [Limisalsivibrio acetivorans]|uniref:type II secretion system protein n=1 Tax=Limisalsivibrio acetivorans TaxID=1304888 RepID=UPI0003B34CBD|nr:hypothetical protein [Limisalsivibrio acetivorans]